MEVEGKGGFWAARPVTKASYVSEAQCVVV